MAEANVGDVLFDRENTQNEEDIWDDRALIKAYDDAISAMKVTVTETNGVSERSDQKAGSSSARRRKNRNKSKKTRKWKAGDVCRAKFTEDGLLYEAEVLSVDESVGTCFVRYTDYGNEEQQELKDLLSHRSGAKKKKETESDIEGRMEEDSDASSVVVNHRKKSSKPSRQQPFEAPHFHPMYNGFPSFPFPDPAAAMFSGMPPPPPPAGSMMGSTMGSLPIPPPPPPVQDMSDSDSEALCSMLMSWYMSGYHTGYYQGLKEGRKKSGTASPFVNR